MRGVNIAHELTEKQLILELAAVCEQVKQYNEAAKLYEKGECYEKAETLFIQTSSFVDADRLIPRISSNQILSNIAKAKEAQKQYREAEAIYEKAKNYEAII